MLFPLAGIQKVSPFDMTFREYLEDCIEKYYSKVLEKYPFQLIEMYSEGMGSLNTYQNKDLKFRIVNDRGLVNAELASLHDSADQYYEIEQFYSYILTRSPDKLLNTWEVKMILCKQLSCEEESDFIINNYDKLIDLLSPVNTLQTKFDLKKIADEYNFQHFGKPKHGPNAS